MNRLKIAFKTKIVPWAGHVSTERLDMFPSISHEMQQLDISWRNALTKALMAHLTKLQGRFNNYIPEKNRDDEWIHIPFGVDVESATMQRNKVA